MHGLRIVACGWLLLLGSFSAGAATLEVVGGQLVGASGVDVNGTLYDVVFLEGSCIEIFSGCDEASDFTFTSLASALAASQALLDQVFLDGASGNFDSNPELIEGCTWTVGCNVFTPYEAVTHPVLAGAALNFSLASGLPDAAVEGSLRADRELDSTGVLAKWNVVPEPATAPLLALGVAGLAAGRRAA